MKKFCKSIFLCFLILHIICLESNSVHATNDTLLLPNYMPYNFDGVFNIELNNSFYASPIFYCVDPNGNLHRFTSFNTAEFVGGSTYSCGTLPTDVKSYLFNITLVGMRVLNNANTLIVYVNSRGSSAYVSDNLSAYVYTFNGVYYQFSSYMRNLIPDGYLMRILDITKYGIVARVQLGHYTEKGNPKYYEYLGYKFNDNDAGLTYTGNVAYTNGYSDTVSITSNHGILNQNYGVDIYFGDTVNEARRSSYYGFEKLQDTQPTVYTNTVTNSYFTWYYNINGTVHIPRKFYDTLTHKAQHMPNLETITGVVKLGSYYYISTSSVVYKSSDLINWVPAYNPGTNTITGLRITKNYVVVNMGTYQVYSSDGVNWYTSNINLTNYHYINNTFVAYDTTYSENRYISNDGVNWVQNNTNKSIIGTVKYSNGYYYNLYTYEKESDGSYYDAYKVYRSTDGINWTYISSNESVFYGISNTDNFIPNQTNDNKVLQDAPGPYFYNCGYNQTANYANSNFEVLGTVLWIHGFNSPPVISYSNNAVIYGNKSSTLTISGYVNDSDGDGIIISASIAGVTKTTYVAGSGWWSLTWSASGDGMADGTYNNIVINASDAKGASSSITTSTSVVIDTINPGAPTIKFHN